LLSRLEPLVPPISDWEGDPAPSLSCSSSSKCTLLPPSELIELLLAVVPYWYSSQLVGFLGILIWVIRSLNMTGYLRRYIRNVQRLDEYFSALLCFQEVKEACSKFKKRDSQQQERKGGLGVVTIGSGAGGWLGLIAYPDRTSTYYWTMANGGGNL